MWPRDDPRGASDGDDGDQGHRRTGGDGPDPDGARAADVIARGVRGAEPGEVPGRLCEVAVELLPVIGASVSLRSEGMPVQLSASSPQAAHLSQIQATLGDGPCQSAVETGAPVLACDLAADRDAGRWPVFAQEATAAGVRAVYRWAAARRAWARSTCTATVPAASRTGSCTWPGSWPA